MSGYSTFGRLSGIAEDQWGLVTRRQAELAGVSRATVQRLASQGVLERVRHGVYRLGGAPVPDFVELRAAWLALAPGVRAWERRLEQGAVSFRSAALVYGLGHLPADRHEFTLPIRRQSRQPDVRLHQRRLRAGEGAWVRGLLVTRPARIVADLIEEREDSEAVGQVIADAVRGGHDDPGSVAAALVPYATRFGLADGDGLALLGWFLDLVGDPQAPRWMKQARADPPASSTVSVRRPADGDEVDR